jgi:hypothetical protein
MQPSMGGSSPKMPYKQMTANNSVSINQNVGVGPRKEQS